MGFGFPDSIPAHSLSLYSLHHLSFLPPLVCLLLCFSSVMMDLFNHTGLLPPLTGLVHSKTDHFWTWRKWFLKIPQFPGTPLLCRTTLHGKLLNTEFLLCPLHAMCISVRALQKGIQSCEFSKRGVRSFPTLLFCRHLLVCMGTLGTGPLLPCLFGCDISPVHIILHTLFVAPVHHFLIWLMVTHSLPIMQHSHKLQKAEKLFPLSQHRKLKTPHIWVGLRCNSSPGSYNAFIQPHNKSGR